MAKCTQIDPTFAEHLMREALLQSSLAAACNEVPVGAVIARGTEVIARAHNTTERDCSVLGHAELNAMKEATNLLQNWRLEECVLCVTLEPCTMCCGAIRLARIPVVIFGAGDSRQGAMGSLYDLSADERMGPATRVIQGVCRKQCESRLKDFFATLRNR